MHGPDGRGNCNRKCGWWCQLHRHYHRPSWFIPRELENQPRGEGEPLRWEPFVAERHPPEVVRTSKGGGLSSRSHSTAGGGDLAAPVSTSCTAMSPFLPPSLPSPRIFSACTGESVGERGYQCARCITRHLSLDCPTVLLHGLLQRHPSHHVSHVFRFRVRVLRVRAHFFLQLLFYSADSLQVGRRRVCVRRTRFHNRLGNTCIDNNDGVRLTFFFASF